MIRLSKTALLLGCAVSVAACTTVGPDYVEPATITETGWIDGSVGEASFADVETWWASLEDPQLARLMREAMTGASDVRIAQARRTRAAALLRRTGAELGPSAEISTEAFSERQSLSANPAIGAIEGFDRNQATFAIAGAAAWELDLFGGARRDREAAFYRYQAADELLRSANVSVALELARLYFSMRAAQQRIAEREEIVRLRDEQMRLAELRYREGYSSRIDRDAVKQALEEAKAELAGIADDAQTAAIMIAALLGKPPEAEIELLDQPASLPNLTPVPRFPRGELVRRRPDIRAAEREVAASVADIGVATAELFPRVALTGGAGVRSLDLGNLVSEPSTFLSLGGILQWRIFDSGRIRAEIDVAKADSRASLVAYEQAVVEALSEAETTLNRLSTNQNAFEARTSAAASALAQSEANAQRFSAGYVNRLEVLSAMISEREAHLAVIELRKDTLIAAVDFYGALGGGWTAAEMRPLR